MNTKKDFTDRDTQNEILEYGFSKKSKAPQLLELIVLLTLASIIIYLIVNTLNLEKAGWPDALMVIFSLAAGIIAYQQWRENRHEISIDKYYDFLGEANERLECLDVSKLQMHVYVELDKLEYVIVKYELGFIPDLFAKRAIDNFKCHCQRTNGFLSCVKDTLGKSAYLDQTKKIAINICEKGETTKVVTAVLAN